MSKYIREAQFTLRDVNTGKEIYFVTSRISQKSKEYLCEIWVNKGYGKYIHSMPLEAQADPGNGRIEDNMGNVWWAKKGKLHREDGPAIEWASAAINWCLKGKDYTGAQFWNKQKHTRHASKIFAYIYGKNND